MRRIVLAVGVALAAAATAWLALLGYGVTAEYGTTPNRGGLGETVGWVAQFVLPAVLVVMAILYAASTGSPLALRRRLVAGGGATALVVVSVAVLAGARA